MITHSNIVNFIKNTSEALDVTSDDIYLQSASIAYALSVRQLMIPLAVGATVVVAVEHEVADPLALFRLIKAQGITLMDVVPSFWRSCVQRLSCLPLDEKNSLLDNSLRRIVSIGETLMSDLPRDWRFQLSHPASLVNIFGQTETTGVIATYLIPPEEQNFVRVVPIGKSVPRTKIYILDPNLQPVQDGEVGELCVSNPCLALGYLNRPDLTAEKFIQNPFDDGFSMRLYRTGDMARYRADGNIEYFGRGDYQVKIRGQRVELGEIESVLREYQAVRDCVVVVRENGQDEKYLAAYVVLDRQQLVDSTDLRNFVRSRLPEYMVPPTFTLLDALPLTPNGKVNRLALPEPEAPGSKKDNPSDELVLPRTAVEKRIAKIWRELMELDQVGIHDEFFDLGGHSLMAVRILTRIEADLGVRLPLTSFFHSGTIYQLSELVNRNIDEVRDWSPVVAIQTNGSKPPFFGIHAHEGGVLFWRDIVENLPKDQPFYAVQAQGVDGIRPALNRIEDMAALYLSAVQKIQSHGPYYLGGFSMGGEIAFEMAQQLLKQGERVNLLLMLDTKNPGHLTRPIAHHTTGDVVPELSARISPDRFDHFGRKIQSLYLEMRKLDWSGKLAYFDKVLLFRLKRLWAYTRAYLYRTLRRRLPDTLLLQYLRYKHSEALRYYVPSQYPGKITLFRASESLEENPTDSPVGWMPLATGGVEIYHFEATHNIVDVEYARDIASKLSECLDAARKFQ
jgi:aspartate racemase